MCYKLSQNLGRPGFQSVYPEVCKARYFIKAASGRDLQSENSFQLWVCPWIVSVPWSWIEW